MRFDRLHIPAFGPFTGLDLVFPDHGADFHIIYGANEAGKSSLLRAFRDLLFGIHGQSPDNFLHQKYGDLRIRAEVVNRAGERLHFQRRKGNKNTLLDWDSNPLPDDALLPFLGSVDREYFSAMFGLGMRELREGAEQLLSGKGDIGNALFSASMGGTPVQKILEALSEESDRLFRGRATANVSIRPGVHKYHELIRKSRDAAVSPGEGQRIESDLRSAEETKVSLEEEVSQYLRELEWISRCEDALPTVGLLNEETRKLKELPSLPDVSSDFVERARAARKIVGDTQAEINRLTLQISNLEEKLANCKTSPGLLSEADSVERLHQNLGVYRERKNSMVDLETELAGLESTLRAGMQDLKLAGDFPLLETLRLDSASQLACEEAAKDLHIAQHEAKKNLEKVESLKGQIETLETQLIGLPETDLADLREALSIAAGAIEADRTLSESESEVKRLARKVKDCHRRLTGAPSDFDMTENLPVPIKATIRRFAEEMDGIKRDINNRNAKILECNRQIDSLTAELARVERRGELPSEENLRKAREHRDRGWSLVLEDWKGGGAKQELIPGMPLDEAFPQAVAHADSIADQLRQQAEAVAQAEEKRFQIKQAEKQNQEADAEITKLQGALKECQTLWERVWLDCGIRPLTPTEMEEWREGWREFNDLCRQFRSADEILQRKRNLLQEARAALAGVLPEHSGEKEFTFLFDEAKRLVQDGEQLSGRRIEVLNQLRILKSQLGPLDQDRTLLKTAVDNAAKKWNAQCKTVGMPDSISTETGLALLQERKDLLVKYDIWKESSHKLRRTADAVSGYERDVREKAVALGVSGDTTGAQEGRLWKLLADAHDNQTRHEQLAGQIEELKNYLAENQAFFAQAFQDLEEILRLAKTETADELEPLLANLEFLKQTQTKISTFRETLIGLARGHKVEDFLARVEAEDVDALTARKRSLEIRKQDKEAALQEVRDTLSELKVQRQRLEAAGGEAANYRQQAESCAARVKQDASRFVRLRLAVHFLQSQIERFRKENQGPLLKKSGEMFARITRGAFSELGAEFNADDAPVLVGLRPDQSPVKIEGMSDGTRDQLYLALRLAALDRYLDRHEPLPLILDDLLVTCDNDRAAAILPELAELAQRAQIFLFTHHEHLVELCHQILGDDTFHLHRLEGR